jgi:O-antigen/teichoic acid export membrane protein
MTGSAETTPGDARSDVTSRKGAFSGGVWNAATVAAPLAGTLALSVVISRELGPDVLGEQSLVAYVASTMLSVVILSFTNATVQLLASAGGVHDDVRAAWLARWSYRAHLVGGGLSAAVLASAALTRDDYRSLWLLAAATALVDAIGWAHAARDVSRNGWSRTAARRLVAQALAPVAGIAAIYAGLGVQGVFNSQLAVSLVLLVALRRLDRSLPTVSFRDQPAPPWRPVAALWGMFAAASVISQVVDRRLELLFLDHFDDARTVAMYSVAFSLVSIPGTLVGALIHAAVPSIAARHVEDPGAVTGALSRAARVVVTLGLLLLGGTVAAGPGLVHLAYGPEFGVAASLVRWLGLVLLVSPLGQLYSTLWSGIGRLRPVLVAGGTAALVDVVLAWTLVPSLSTTGAVIATASAQSVMAIMLIVHTHRSGIRLSLPVGRLARTVLITAVATGAAMGVGSVGGLAGDLLPMAVFGVLVALGSRLLGLFQPEDTDWLADTVPGPAARVLRALSPR